MSANEPPNPYTPPSSALADGTTADATRTTKAEQPPRGAAVVAALFGFPQGAGLYLLGRPRAAGAWAAAGLLAVALAIVAIRVPWPKFALFSIVPLLAVWLAAAVVTIKAKPGSTPIKHAGRWAALLIVVAIGVNAAVKQWLVEAFSIPSGGMMPTLLVGDHIYVRKGHSDVARGDAVVFEFPHDRSVVYIKRAVAIGGDTIEVREGVPWINGVALDHQPVAEPCVYDDSGPPDDRGPRSCTLVRETNAGHAYTIMLIPDAPAQDHPRTTVPPGHVFVMGDNRDNSYDSRKWGTVPLDAVKGVPTMTWWSTATDRGVRWSRVGHGVE